MSHVKKISYISIVIERLTMNNYRKNRYPQGYLPKIARYQVLLNQAVLAGDVEQIKYYGGKVAYFAARQNEVYGRMAELYND